jgi:hypothetical protein
MIDYPIMSRRDEKQQADITSKQTSSSAWISTNEARRAAGQPDIELPIANEVLIPVGKGRVPLSVLNEQYFGEKDSADEGGLQE